MVGVSRNTISSIETGQFNPTAKLALILCIALVRNLKNCFIFSRSRLVLITNMHIIGRIVDMKITVITGTEIRGITYRLKNLFVEALGSGHDITEFYLPKDMPYFCCGCKNCFFKSEHLCPHANSVMPIWESIKAADLIVFATPVYALRVPGQVKALLDHWCCHWAVHRPDPDLFDKKAVILTNSIGAPNGATQKDIATSLSWLCIPHIRKLGVGLMEGVIWDELSAKRRERIAKRIRKLAARYRTPTRARRTLKIRFIWGICKSMHKGIAKNENPLSADNQYWKDKGWI